MNYPLLIHLSLFGIAALGATLVLGCLRRFPLGFIGSVAVGAYVSACLHAETTIGWPLAIACGTIAGSIFAWLPALFDEALVGDEYAVFSWMTAIAAYEVISLLEITGGQHSLTGITPFFSGVDGVTKTAWLLLSLFLLFFASLLVFRRSQTYEHARLVGLNPTILAASGQNARFVSWRIHLLAGAFAGFAGGLWGPVYQSLHPSQFQLPETIVILLVCLIGGKGEPIGVVVGLIVVFLIPTLVEFEQLAPSFAALSNWLGVRPPDPVVVSNSLFQMFLGLILVLTVLFVRRGFVPAARDKINRVVAALKRQSQS